jgi:peptidoglycan hydrolase-like protein with peptidoglycan-binding domain
MRKVYDFSTFNFIYEATTPATEAPKATAPTEESKLYDKTLGLILTTALNAYSSELVFPTKPYEKNIDADIASVKSSPVTEKPAALVKIMDKVKAASADNTLEGAKEAVDAWVAAGTKTTEALAKMIEQYKDKEDELKHINDFVNARLDAYLVGLKTSSQGNSLKDIVTKLQASGSLPSNSGEAKKESNSYDGEDYIFEGFLEGKKGMIGDVSKQITLVNAKLASLLKTPGMEADVKKLQNEVTQISAAMGNLLGKKNREISKDEIKKAAERLAAIPTEADAAAEKMLKQDTTNKEAAAILIQALGLAEEAAEKEKTYLGKKEEALKKDEASKVVYDKNKSGEVNPKVGEFQKLVTDKFKNIKSISDLPGFKNMGSSGKFGPATAAVVKALKTGYGLKDADSSDITKELFTELSKEEVIKESRILTFGGFNRINEEFDVKAAASTLKSSYSPTSSGASGTKSSGGSSSAVVFKEGSKGPEVTAIQNVVKAPVGADEKGDKDKGIPATFGAKTKEAVIAWQKANGFTGKDADGIVGPTTLKKMAEMKNLGTWTASMISKLSKVEVKPLENKPKEVKIDQSIIDEIAKGIYDSVSGNGTDEDKLKSSILKIKNLEEFKAVEKKLGDMYEDDGEPRSAKPIETLVNNELGTNDFDSVKSIVNHLKNDIKLNVVYKSREDMVSGEKLFIEDSFKYNY